MATTDYSLDRGLPASIDAERAILGAILLDNLAYHQAAQAALLAEDFSLDSHRRIYLRMTELCETGRPVDFVTLSEQLGQHKEIESVGGVAYVTSLTDGLPRVKNIEQYVKIVKDKALLRSLIHAATSAIQTAYEQEAPAEEIIDSAESAIFQIAEHRMGQGFVAIPDIVKSSFGSIDRLLEQGQQITGLRTHFQELDNLTSGFQKSDLIIIAARPSMGKTAFAVNIAENAAISDKKVVGLFSLEMSRQSLILRMLCSQAMVDSHKVRTGFYSREDRGKLVDGLAALMDAPIFIDDAPGISISEMRAKCRRLQQVRGRLDLVIVDYLQLVAAAPAGGRRYENRTQEVSAISRGLKMMAKEMNCPVVALSQLSRAPEARTGNNRPQLSDLRESGAIEQDADVVGFIFREEVYKPDDPDLEGKAELIIAKQRNGPTGTVRLAFVKRSTRFTDLADDTSPPMDVY
ncbi:MAG TPA: replicative DNA helicase [Verrucomicrobiae bacterium]|jgi:replicative DNA helicase|nr:replicative DNA helicase [Verrucomicrobiae bacterium]